MARSGSKQRGAPTAAAATPATPATPAPPAGPTPTEPPSPVVDPVVPQRGAASDLLYADVSDGGTVRRVRRGARVGAANTLGV